MANAKVEDDQDKHLAADKLRSAILREMPTPLKMSELLKSIVVWAVELLRADAGELYLWNPKREGLRLSISHGFIESYAGVILKPGEGMAGRVYQSGEPMMVDDYATWEGRSAAFESHPPFITVLQVPMKWQERIIGVLSIDADKRRRTFDKDDVRLGTLFANLAAVAIENTRLYGKLQDRSERSRHILEHQVAQRTAELAHRALQMETCALVSREISSILDIDKLLARVVELISEAFDYYSVGIFMVDSETNRLILRSANGKMGRRLVSQGLSIKMEAKSLNSKVARTNETVLVNDVTKETHYLSLELLPDTRSELIVPLRIGKRILGTMDIQSDKVHAFSQEDILVIQSLGDQVAIAIENARLYNHSRELAVLEERNRLARELHDSVTQTLFSMTLTAEAAQILAERNPRRASTQLQRLQKLAQGALIEMRSLISQLRPKTVTEEGLVPALRQHIAERRDRDGLAVVLHLNGERELPREYKEALFRIVQEALNNVVKHAQADRAEITLDLTGGAVSLAIEDSGIGFDLTRIDSEAWHLGLVSMRERAEMLGGTLTVESQPGQGTCIRVEIPHITES